MDCPFCERSLLPFEEHQIHLDRCPVGHGIWFDRGELVAYKKTHPKFKTPSAKEIRQFQYLPGEVERDCPRCQTTTLGAGSLGNLEVHQCSTCRGIFLGQSKQDSQKDENSPGAGADVGGWIIEALLEGLINGLIIGLE